MKRVSAKRYYGGIAAWLTVFIFLTWWYFVSWPVLVVYICAINMTTVLLYAYDKVNAMRNGREGALGCKVNAMRNGRGAVRGGITRVPEVVLHSLALLGGSPMAIIGQKVFRHKTRKITFQRWQWLVIIVQILLISLYFYQFGK